MEKAIQKAIEGGWNKIWTSCETPTGISKSHDYRDWNIQWKDTTVPQIVRQNDFLLDPLFWQALGKAMGWGKKMSVSIASGGGTAWHTKKWQAHWHDFIDHLAEGKDAESFFAELIK